MGKIPYGPIDRDLHELVIDRVSTAIRSVIQLADNPGAAFLVAIAAHQAALANLAGTYSVHYGQELGTFDPLEVAAAVNEATRAALAKNGA
jgi:hypothetical protein